MAQVFHPSANTIARLSIFGGVFVVLAALVVTYMVIQSPYQTEVHVVKAQPVQFSHEHHVAGLGIDCRYCHTSVEESPYAGMPPTYTCMSCHSQVWTDSPMLAPVRRSLAENEPIHWNRVHDLPDYAYFDHSIHVNKGVGCAECHGRMDRMPLAWKEEPMTMGWCLECHRDPEPHLRPPDEIYNVAWSVENDQADLKALIDGIADQETRDKILADDFISRRELGGQLAREYNVPTLGHDTPLTNCAVCHR